MPIIRMQLFQFAGEGVGVGGGELGFAETPDGIENIQRPAALGDGNFFQRLNPPEFSRTSLSGDTLLSVTTEMRASAGTRFNAMLQPTHPALRAVAASGLRLMMAEGEHTRLACGSRRLVANVGEKIFDAGARRTAREARALPILS